MHVFGLITRDGRVPVTRRAAHAGQRHGRTAEALSALPRAVAHRVALQDFDFPDEYDLVLCNWVRTCSPNSNSKAFSIMTITGTVILVAKKLVKP